MEFAWTAEQLAFRKRLRDLLDNELLIGWEDAAKHGPGGDSVVAFASRFCPALASHGLLVRHWPREYGGEDGKPWEHFILGEEMFAAGEPRGPQYMNVNWIGPAIMRYGKPEQKRFHLPQIANGTAFWCQGFSEPSAGSDLASLRTRAVKTADGYVINGSKIWTSYATAAEYCFLLARTGESKKGISVFLVRMDTPGIDVRQIKGIVADGSLNEVFLTDVKVREADRLGEDGRGWEVVTHALAQERVGSAKYAYARRALDTAITHLQANGRFRSQAVRERAARVAIACEAARMLTYRAIDDRAKLRASGPEANMVRWSMAMADKATNEFISDFVPEALTTGDFPYLLTYYRRNTSAGIGGGSAEIQLNLVASRFLELPREA